MILNEKVEYRIFGNTEYVLNLLLKHHVCVISPLSEDESCRIKILRKDKEKLERILKNYGKKFEVINIYTRGEIFKKINKKYLIWIGLVVTVFMISIYSQAITDIKINGCNKIAEEVIIEAIQEDLKSPFFVTRKVTTLIENNVREMDGIAYVATTKKGRTLEINIVEELSKTNKIDTQNKVFVKALESGVVTKIMVYGGTQLINVGDEVIAGQDLIAPYFINSDGVTRPTYAFGKVEAKVTRTIELTYLSEEDYNEHFINDYEKQTALCKENLKAEDKYIGAHFFVKNVDKSIVCSIYYDILTRIA